MDFEAEFLCVGFIPKYKITIGLQIIKIQKQVKIDPPYSNRLQIIMAIGVVYLNSPLKDCPRMQFFLRAS